MISYNHIGYRTNGPKVFYIDAPQEEEFHIYTIDATVEWQKVYTGKLVPCGKAYVGDFSSITTPADYQIRCGTEKSFDFVVKDDPYNHLERGLVNFYLWQRCGSKKGWAGLCHQQLDNLYGTDKKLDMRGGYHQSGDLRCWHDGCSSAIYGYMRFAEAGKPLWDDGDLDEEIRWGVDYFRKTVSPEGFVYDCQFVPLGWGSRDYYNSPAPLSDHYNICRLLARSAVYFRESDPGYARENIQLAEKVWRYVEASDAFDIPYVPPVDNLPRGTQKWDFYWQTRKHCAAMDSSSSATAYDLFLATGNPAYFERAMMDMQSFLACQIHDGDAAGLFRDSFTNTYMAFQDCSYGYRQSGVVFLADLIQDEPDSPYVKEWKNALERYCDMLVREYERVGLTGETPRPIGESPVSKQFPKNTVPFADSPIPLVHHVSNGSSLAAEISYVLAVGYELFGKKEYQVYAQHALDYLLGCNPSGASYVTGFGYNHLYVKVYGQFFPSTPLIPGGITHVRPGEYDLPVAGILLRTLTRFRDHKLS